MKKIIILVSLLAMMGIPGLLHAQNEKSIFRRELTIKGQYDLYPRGIAHVFPKADRILVEAWTMPYKQPPIEAYDFEGNKQWEKQMQLSLDMVRPYDTHQVSPSGRYIVLTRQRGGDSGAIVDIVSGKVILDASTPTYKTKSLFGSGGVKFSDKGNYILVDSGEGQEIFDDDEDEWGEWQPDKACLLETVTGKVVWCRKESRGVKNLVVIETSSGPLVEPRIPKINWGTPDKNSAFLIHNISQDRKRIVYTQGICCRSYEDEEINARCEKEAKDVSAYAFLYCLKDVKTYLGQIENSNFVAALKQLPPYRDYHTQYSFLEDGTLFVADDLNGELILINTKGEEFKRWKPKKPDCRNFTNVLIDKEAKILYWEGYTGKAGCDTLKQPMAADWEGDVIRIVDRGGFYPIPGTREYIVTESPKDPKTGKTYLEIYRGILPKKVQEKK